MYNYILKCMKNPNIELKLEASDFIIPEKQKR